MGWARDGGLHPILMTLDPISEACIVRQGVGPCAAAVAKQISHVHMHVDVDIPVIPLLAMTGVSMTIKWIG